MDFDRFFFFLFIYIIWQIFSRVKKKSSTKAEGSSFTVKALQVLQGAFSEGGVDLEKAMKAKDRRPAPVMEMEEVPSTYTIDKNSKKRQKPSVRRQPKPVTVDMVERQQQHKMTKAELSTPSPVQRHSTRQSTKRRRLRQAVIWAEILEKPVGMRE